MFGKAWGDARASLLVEEEQQEGTSLEEKGHHTGLGAQIGTHFVLEERLEACVASRWDMPMIIRALHCLGDAGGDHSGKSSPCFCVAAVSEFAWKAPSHMARTGHPPWDGPTTQ